MKSVLKGLSSLLSLLLAVLVTASTLLFDNAGKINQYLNVTTSVLVESEDADEDADTTYYAADVLATYGDTSSTASALKVEMAAAAESVTQAEEGTVVLTNNNDILPLEADGTTKITVFGNGSYNSRYNKSKSESTVEAIPMVTFNDALISVYGEENVNITLAENVYSSMSTTDNTTVYEADISEVKQYESTWASTGSVAMVVLTRWGTEDSETAMYNEDGTHYLGLCAEEQDLMEYLQEGEGLRYVLRHCRGHQLRPDDGAGMAG